MKMRRCLLPNEKILINGVEKNLSLERKGSSMFGSKGADQASKKYLEKNPISQVEFDSEQIYIPWVMTVELNSGRFFPPLKTGRFSKSKH